MAFKDVLKDLRKNEGLTQEDLGKKIGLAKSTISMYENGKREPNMEMLELFADFFNVDMNRLLGVSSNYTCEPEINPNSEPKKLQTTDEYIESIMGGLNVHLRANDSLTEKEKDDVYDDLKDFVAFKLAKLRKDK